ncbi:unnamed protein product [Paramecium sonneborni]|uniref:Uncharacterized protein n=1 Tax=Paramecium sonneborni TaxID=65129 RepID=A0A8S1RTM5_9CILI|nr:unnamed protein product [Paramecium sonneborni]
MLHVNNLYKIKLKVKYTEQIQLINDIKLNTEQDQNPYMRNRPPKKIKSRELNQANKYENVKSILKHSLIFSHLQINMNNNQLIKIQENNIKRHLD